MHSKSCAQCGAQLADGNGFCARCGTTDHHPDELASTSELPILARPDLRRPLAIGAMVLALVLVLAGVGAGVLLFAHHRAAEQRRELEQRRAADAQRQADERRAARRRGRLASLRTACQALDGIDAALANGASFVDYGNALRDAAAAFADLEAADTEAADAGAADDRAKAVRIHLAAALELHRTAHRLTALTVDVGRPAEGSAKWFRHYRRRHPEVYSGAATTGRAALKDIWSRATQELQAAHDGLAALEKSP
ncbi:MAG: zinc ribbon domain-containing protein [Steroidobacteraceae bacterium]